MNTGSLSLNSVQTSNAVKPPSHSTLHTDCMRSIRVRGFCLGFRQTPSPQWADLLIQGLKLIVCLPSATFAMWQGLVQKTAPTLL